MTARPFGTKKLEYIAFDEKDVGTLALTYPQPSAVREEFWFMCKGCSEGEFGIGIHYFTTKRKPGDNGPVWTFNGNIDKPTFRASLLYRWNEKGIPKVCHLFMTEGVIQYLPDCTHSFAGKNVPLTECEDV